MEYLQEYKLFTEPYDDEKAKWDEGEQVYVLDADYFKKRTGVDPHELLQSENQVNAFFLTASHRLYNIVDSYANRQGWSNNVKVKRYIMKHNYDKRKPIIDALVSFARAALDTDIDRIGDEWSLRGQLIKKTNEMDLPLDTKRILDAAELTYNGKYGYTVEE